MEISLPYPPSTNRAWRNIRGRVVQSEQSREWKNRAGWLARQQGAEILTGPVAVSITLHPKLTKQGNISKIRLDIDNLTKPTLDALNGIMWEDDKQIVALHIALGHPLPGGGLTLSATSPAVQGGEG